MLKCHCGEDHQASNPDQQRDIGEALTTLERRLTTTSATLFGLSYICPTVVVSTFGVIADTTSGASSCAYILATLAIVLSASSYGRMAARYSQAGSAYTYVSSTTNPTLGFVVGWALLLDYLFIPMVVCLFTAKAVEVVLPNISFRPWIVLVALITTGINILGIKVADRVNLVIMFAQLAAMAALVAVCIVYLGAAPHTAAALASPILNSHSTLPAVMTGTAIACYSFTGFDAVTTLSEETLDPTRSIPRATVLAPVIGGTIFAVSTYVMSLVHPSSSFHDLDNAGFEVLAQAGGPLFLLAFTLVLIVSYVAAVLCAQAGSARLVFAMGRNGVLPKGFFGYLHPRLRTPVLGLLLMGAVMFIGEFIDVETAASCVNFGAFTAFFSVNCCVLIDHLGGRRQLAGGATKVVIAALGAVATFCLLLSLTRTAHVVGLVWLSIGLLYTAWRTRAFQAPLPFVELTGE